MCILMQSNSVEVYWIYIMYLACNYKDDLFCFFHRGEKQYFHLCVLVDCSILQSGAFSLWSILVMK